MLLKSLLTGTILAGMAGGVVYFGTGGDIADADIKKAVENTKTAAVNMAEQTTESAKAKIDALTQPKKTNDKKKSSFIERNTTEVEIIDTPEVEKTIDMSFDDGQAPQDDEKSDNEKSDDESDEKKWLNQYLKKREAAKTDDEADEVQEEAERQDGLGVDSLEVEETIDDIVEDTAAFEDIEEEKILLSLPGSDNATARFIVKDKKSALPKWDDKAFDGVYATVLAQAENIEIVDLKNRAYLSLIDYGIREGQFERSLDVIENISQAELRDTARSNIAVGLARKGQSDEAFDVLKNVETEALSDVLRLQVIEAMTGPSSDNL